MLTLGIDLSSQPKATVACLIEWNEQQAIASPPRLQCSDPDLDTLIREADVIGIDAPFGWPREFETAIAQWTLTSWDEAIRDRLRFRETDRIVRRETGLNPLSVSSDRIALPAMRAMALLQRHGVTDRSGDGRFFDVYPAGSLRCWDISNRGYKDAKKSECADARRKILDSLRTQLPWLQCDEEYAASSDAVDALLASLTARAAAQGRSIRPASDQVSTAQREGWIHLPNGSPQP